ncbi:MAG: chromosome partitioning protein ParB [Solirubrobacteraceae bacterium]
MPAPRSTGVPSLDAQTDFLRARRRAALGAMVARLRGEPDDVRHILPYEEVVAALGYVSEHSAGQAVVPLDAIVGTVGRSRDFDRSFRPTTGRVRSRWEHIDAAMRRGEAMPPVDLVRIGQIYFVRDGHHRISVARALGRADIDAYVTEVVTRVGAERAITLEALPVKSHERVFFERVPLPDNARAEIQLTDPWDYGRLAEAVEAWGFRLSQDRQEPASRRETAFLWLKNEYRPVVEMLRGADLIGTNTETEAYMRVSAARYRLLRTHTWDEDVLAAVVDELSRKNRRRRKTDVAEP